MKLTDVKTIIERAESSLQASNDDAYKETLQKKVEALKYKICRDQEVGDISWIDYPYELSDYLVKEADELEQSI